jgi:hypothetical protein
MFFLHTIQISDAQTLIHLSGLGPLVQTPTVGALGRGAVCASQPPFLISFGWQIHFISARSSSSGAWSSCPWVMTMTWSFSHPELRSIATPLHAAKGVGGVLAILVIDLITLVTCGEYGRAPVLSQGPRVTPQALSSLKAWRPG